MLIYRIFAIFRDLNKINTLALIYIGNIFESANLFDDIVNVCFDVIEITNSLNSLIRRR